MMVAVVVGGCYCGNTAEPCRMLWLKRLAADKLADANPIGVLLP